MRKKELINIPLDEINKHLYINLIEIDIPYLISSRTITDGNKDKILVLSFFKKTEHKNTFLKVKYRVFINKKKNDYITQYFYNENDNEFRWLTGTINNTITYSFSKKCMLINEKSTNTILKYFNINENPLLAISEFQEDVLIKRLAKRNKAEMDKVESKMKLVPKTPKNFDKWIDETALINSRYIYYKYQRTKKPIQGYCTHCKQLVMISNPKHNTRGICPSCKSKITFKSQGKSKFIQDKSSCCILQKLKGSNTIVVRYFEAYKTYGEDYKNPKLSIVEYLRDIYYCNNLKDDLKIETFEYRKFKQTGLYCWCKGIQYTLYSHQYDFNNIVLYKRNLGTVLKGTFLEYSQLKQYAVKKSIFNFPIYDYIKLYSLYPFIEYLVKLNLTNLVSNMPRQYFGTIRLSNVFNVSGNNFAEIIKLDKRYIPVMQEMNINIKELEVLQNSYTQGINLTNDQIRYIADTFPIDTFFYISKYTTSHKIIKYMDSQNNKYYSLIDWKDYITNCELLNYDLKNEFILFPKNLKEKHDELISLITKNNLKRYNEKIKQQHKKLSQLYNWDNEDYSITVAKDADSLVSEGHNLHHCVGTSNYIKNMAIGKITIVFLRKISEPNKSFYTLEIKDNKIIQTRGLHNCSPTEDIEKVINDFKIDKLVENNFEQAM